MKYCKCGKDCYNDDMCWWCFGFYEGIGINQNPIIIGYFGQRGNSEDPIASAFADYAHRVPIDYGFAYEFFLGKPKRRNK